MTALQKLQLEQSEKRESLNALLGVKPDELSDEQRAEMSMLTIRLNEMEPELRAAITVQSAQEAAAQDEFSETDGQTVELRALIEGANVGNIFDATIQHRATDGRTAELQQHFGVASNQIPIALLRERIEQRAVTPGPANTQGNQQPIIPQVFPMSVATFLGIDMPVVPVGQAIFPVITTGATVHVPAENDAAAETTGAFSAESLKPGRLQASFFYSREDASTFVGMGESLRMNLVDALADKLDDEILTGTNGLFAGANLADHDSTAVFNYAAYRSGLLYSRVDGRYAGSGLDIRIVMGSGTYAHSGGAYRGNQGDVSALDSIMANSGGVRVSAHVPAVASNKQEAIVRRGMRRDMVAPIWEGVTLIPDEVTKAANGQIVITAVMLHAIKILRTGGFVKVETQHA